MALDSRCSHWPGSADTRHARPWLELPGAATQINTWSTISGLTWPAWHHRIRGGDHRYGHHPAAGGGGHPAGQRRTRRRNPGRKEDRRRGHSVGEIAAYAIAGVISRTTRSGSPPSAAPRWPRPAPSNRPAWPPCWAVTKTRFWRGSPSLDLIPANRNAAGQIVAAGPPDGAGEAGRRPARQGPGACWPPPARSTPNTWPRPWTGRPRRPQCPPTTPHHPAVQLGRPTGDVGSGRDGQARRSATRPVRWDLCNATLAQLNVAAIVEFPPAGALTGIAKRELRGVATHAVKAPADLDPDALAEL